MVVCAELALSASTALANKRRDSLHAWMFWHYKHRFGCELSTWTRRYQGCFLRGRRSCSDTVMKRTKTFCRSWKTKKHANPNRSSTTARPDKLTVNLVWCSCWTNAVATEKNDGTKVRETAKVTCFFWSSIRLHVKYFRICDPAFAFYGRKVTARHRAAGTSFSRGILSHGVSHKHGNFSQRRTPSTLGKRGSGGHRPEGERLGALNNACRSSPPPPVPRILCLSAAVTSFKLFL